MSKRIADSSLDNRRKQKKNRLPLSTMQKVELLQKLDRGVSVMRLTVEYGVGTTTIYDLKRQRDKLLEFYTECNDRRFLKNRKKTHEAKNEELERVLIDWVRQQRLERLPLTGSMVLTQVRKYHQELNIPGEGEYSENWLQKFKKRHNLKFLQISGETVSIEEEDAEEINLSNETEMLTQSYPNTLEAASRPNPASETLSSSNSFIQHNSLSSHPTAPKLQKKTERQFGNRFLDEIRQLPSTQSTRIAGPSLPVRSQLPVQQNLQAPAPPPALPKPPLRQVQLLAPPVQVPVAKPKPVEKPRPREKRIFVVADHQRCVMSNLSSLWKSGKLCDAGIGNGSSTVMVHKVVLSAVCPKLLSVFSTDILSHKFLQVNFPEEVSTEALNAFAEYMYNGILDLDRDILEQLKIIAKRLDMKEFEQLCDSHLPNHMHQPAAAAVASFTNVPLIQTSMQFPSMTSSLPSLSSTISAPVQSAPSITTQVIDVKQEISEAELAQVRKDTAAVFGQESEVASLAPNKSGNTAGFVICPSVKTEPVGPEDDKYGHLSSNNNNQTFTSTVPSSSSSSLAAASTSITSVPASQTEFAIPFSETTDVKSTKLKASHSYESPLVSDLSPVSCIVETVCSQSSHMTEDSSKSLNWLSNFTSSVECPSTSTTSGGIYPVGLFTSGGDNLPLLTTQTVDLKNIDLYKTDLT